MHWCNARPNLTSVSGLFYEGHHGHNTVATHVLRSHRSCAGGQSTAVMIIYQHHNWTSCKFSERHNPVPINFYLSTTDFLSILAIHYSRRPIKVHLSGTDFVSAVFTISASYWILLIRCIFTSPSFHYSPIKFYLTTFGFVGAGHT